MPNGRMLILTGAPGAGKTAVLADLRRLLPGAVVIDMDDVLAAASRLAGTDLTQTAATERWTALTPPAASGWRRGSPMHRSRTHCRTRLP